MGRIDVAAEAAIARIAAARMELVPRADLLAAGIAVGSIDRRVRTGQLRRVHRGLYTTAKGPLSREQRWQAAALACGDRAWVSDGHAAALWRILATPPEPVTVLHDGPRRDGPAGVALRRTSQLPAGEVATHRGVRVTSPARTLLDLAAADHPGVELGLNEALALRLVSREELHALTRSGRSGAARLRALLQPADGYTRAGAEQRLRGLLRRAGLPVARHNAPLLGAEVDALFGEERLVVEVDGYATHGHRAAFERDRAADQRRIAHGYRTMRVTWRQLTQEPEAVAARLGAALARSG